MKLLAIGATSAIAQETLKLFAKQGAALFLVGRTADKLAATAADLKIRGASQVETYLLDVTDYSQHAAMFQTALEKLGGLDTALIAHGTLGDQTVMQDSVEESLQDFNSNCLSVIALLIPIAKYLEKQGSGTIAVISSVAGDRGRPSNYVYGSAKAGLNAYLQGLRGRLFKAGVNVVTIKPGLVDTPMTAHLKKGPLMAKPEAVGLAIYKAILKGKEVLYVPGFWFVIMTIIKSIPEPIFKRLNLKA